MDSRITLRSIRATRPRVARRAKHPRCRSIRIAKNIPLYRNSELADSASTPAQGRGAYRDRHERGPGSGGRGPHRREGFCRAGDREQRPRANDRCDQRTAKSCRPGARGLCAKSCGDVRCPTGHTCQPSATATGAIVHRSPGRARHKPFQPLRREGRDAPVALLPAVHCSADYSWHGGPWEPIGSRSSLRPLSIGGEASRQSSGETSREDAMVCLR